MSKPHIDPLKAVSRQAAHCPHCGMSRSMMRWAVYTAMAEGFVAGALFVAWAVFVMSGYH